MMHGWLVYLVEAGLQVIIAPSVLEMALQVSDSALQPSHLAFSIITGSLGFPQGLPSLQTLLAPPVQLSLQLHWGVCPTIFLTA